MDVPYPPELGPRRDHVPDPVEERKIRREVALRRLGVTFGALGIVGTLVLGTYTSLSVRDSQLNGTPTGDKLLESADRILDCTDPGGTYRPPGKCYSRGRAQTAEVLASVQRITVLAAACAVDVDASLSVAEREASITNCIVRALAKPAPKP